MIHTKVKICLVRRSRGGNLRKSGYIRGAKDAFPKWVSIQTSLWEYEWSSTYQLNKHVFSHPSCHPFPYAPKSLLFLGNTIDRQPPWKWTKIAYGRPSIRFFPYPTLAALIKWMKNVITYLFWYIIYPLWPIAKISSILFFLRCLWHSWHSF